jgi:hypothetical protein
MLEAESYGCQSIPSPEAVEEIMDNSRFDWAALQLLLITVVAFVVGLAGCGPIADSYSMSAAANVPAELAPFQGKWKLDEARSRNVPAGEDDGQTEEMPAEEKAFFAAMKKLGVVMSDIEIRALKSRSSGACFRRNTTCSTTRATGERSSARPCGTKTAMIRGTRPTSRSRSSATATR